MENKGTVSIIIPVYNAQQYLSALLEGLVRQSYPFLEIICVDDGSSDGSYALCCEAAERDHRITVVRQKNGGVSAARNTGLEKASGHYIMFVDADDSLPETAVEDLISAAEGADLVVGNLTVHHADGIKVRKNRLPYGRYTDIHKNEKQILMDYVFQPQNRPHLSSSIYTNLYRRALIEQHHMRFDSRLKYGEDSLFVCVYLAQCRVLVTVDKEVYTYNLTNAGQATKKSGSRWEHLRLQALLKKELLEREQIPFERYADTFYREVLSRSYQEIKNSLHYRVRQPWRSKWQTAREIYTDEPAKQARAYRKKRSTDLKELLQLLGYGLANAGLSLLKH